MTPDKIKQIDTILKQFDTRNSPGVVAGVIQNGNTEYAKAFGMANLEHDLPLDLNSVLQAGSVSKQFTAFAVLLLCEQGKINLDATVREYLNYVPEFDHDITVRHLVHHVSGLRSTLAFMAVNGVGLQDPYTKELEITIARTQQTLNFEPDTFYTYCNLGYSLLAEIVAAVTGKTFRQYADQAIFTPLGMDSSFFHDTPFELIKNKAESYTAGPQGFANCPLTHSSYGSTNLFTTIRDLIKWAKELLTPEIFPKKLIETAFTPHECKNGHKTGYGFGLEVYDYKGCRAVTHGGFDAAYRAHVFLVPEKSTGVLLLANRDDFATPLMSKRIIDILLDLPEDTYDDIPESEDISGVYYVEKGVGIYPIVKTEKGTFVTNQSMETRVFKKGEAQYVIPMTDTEFTIGENESVTFLGNGSITNGLKINPAPITEEDKKYAGKYIGIEFDSVHEVVFTGDTLVLWNNKTGKLPFKKYDNGIYIDTVFEQAILWFSEDSMVISSHRAKGVTFKKFSL